MQGKGYVPDSVPVVVLISSVTYSGANIAVYLLSDLRECIFIGEKTGGGGGPRREVLLPNYWTLAFPFGKYFSPSDKNMEYGFEPNIYVKQNNNEGKDSILITALKYLDNL